jgi:hypothetical protein
MVHGRRDERYSFLVGVGGNFSLVDTIFFPVLSNLFLLHVLSLE